MSPAKPKRPKIELLYQPHPKTKSWREGSRSNTESTESYHLEALHEYGRLMVNGTVPNHIVQVNYLTEISKKEIQAQWKRQSRRLRIKGIVARVGLEITKDKWRQRLVNRVHYHFVAKDDRTPDEMGELFETVWRLERSCIDVKVHVRQFIEELGGWKGYIEYFLKLWDENYIPLAKGGPRRYYTVNEDRWWTYPDGSSRSIESIDRAVQLYAVAERLKLLEKFVPVQHRPPAKQQQPTDDRAMKGLLCNQTDETLYDWFATLRGKPKLFGSDIPKWLTDTLQSQWKKRRDLLEALYDRVSDAENKDIIFALKIYHRDITYDGISQKLVSINGGKVFAGTSFVN